MLAKKGLMTAPAAVAQYVEDVFSTYLYTGTGSAQTITNNIDISGEDGLVWVKARDQAAGHLLADTINGTTKHLQTNTTGAAFDGSSSYITGFSSTGFSVGSSIGVGANGIKHASWTFRKAEKFFDVVTYTGNGASSHQIAHNLGSTPGCIIVKAVSSVGSNANWIVWHRSLSTSAGYLNTTDAFGGGEYSYNFNAPTSTYIDVKKDGSFASATNDNGVTYVAYLFAHDAGGFGDAGDQSVIKCGSFTTDGSGNATVDLGWEPQWVLSKASSSTSDWRLWDNMRPFTPTNASYLEPNTSDAEADNSYWFQLRSNGFYSERNANTTYIYIAIRRGPMKTPEAGTEVFSPVTYTGNGTSQTITSPGFTPDMLIGRIRASSTASVVDKLRGSLNYLYTSSTDAEVGSNSTSDVTAFTNTGFNVGADNRGNWNTSSGSEIVWTFGRAPGFFDVVCYTGNGSYGRTISHNLGVAPELLIVKQRSLARGWAVYAAPLGATEVLQLHLSDAKSTSDWFANTTPTSSVFSVGSNQIVNENSQTFVAYLFASVTGVSKVGSYTGTGVDGLQINCGFTSGARFVLIKRTDSANDWHVFDSARGIVSGNDPYLKLNTTGAEVTTEDIVDTYSSGFIVNAYNGVNANGGTYIYLAIA